MNSFASLWRHKLSAAVLLAGTVCGLRAQSLDLKPKADVDGGGVFLNQIVAQGSDSAVANILVMPSPAWGAPKTIEREEISRLVASAAPQLAATSWSGAAKIQIGRKSRSLEAPELLKILTEKLQPAESGPNNTELELTARDWKPIQVPAGPVDLKVLDRPSAGLTPNFMVKFEVMSGTESVGQYSTSVFAHLFQEVWVAHSVIRRLTELDQADLVREKRDLITLKEPAWQGERLDHSSIVTEYLSAGGVLSAKAVAATPVVHRNQPVKAILKSGAITISMSGIVLEEGAPGQVIRVLNSSSKKIIQGKVIDADTVEVGL